MGPGSAPLSFFGWRPVFPSWSSMSSPVNGAVLVPVSQNYLEGWMRFPGVGIRVTPGAWSTSCKSLLWSLPKVTGRVRVRTPFPPVSRCYLLSHRLQGLLLPTYATGHPCPCPAVWGK